MQILAVQGCWCCDACCDAFPSCITLGQCFCDFSVADVGRCARATFAITVCFLREPCCTWMLFTVLDRGLRCVKSHYCSCTMFCQAIEFLVEFVNCIFDWSWRVQRALNSSPNIALTLPQHLWQYCFCTFWPCPQKLHLRKQSDRKEPIFFFLKNKGSSLMTHDTGMDWNWLNLIHFLFFWGFFLVILVQDLRCRANWNLYSNSA